MYATYILYRCRTYESETNNLVERILRLRDCATNSTTNLSLAGRGSCGGDKMTAFASALDEYERELEQRHRMYRCELLAACRICETLSSAEGNVLYEYYVKKHKLKDIAKRSGYALRHVQRLKADGESSAKGLDQAWVNALLPDWYKKMSYDVV